MLDHTTFRSPTLVPVNGIQLEVFEAGAENAGRPILLCHGWPEHAFTWRHQMPALAAAGYHVIVPNQRGYGNSSRPAEVSEYDIIHLAGDLVALLDHYGYDDAVFVGHDWGAMVAWWLTLLHPSRVSSVVALSMTYMERGDTPWVEAMEAMVGDEFYFVHFNRHPGVSDAVLDANTHRFLHNLFRQSCPPAPPVAPMSMIDVALAEEAAGEAVMSDEELAVFVTAFEASGFTSSINWYRNVDRNWHLLADVDPYIHQPALMIHGTRDLVARNERLAEFVPNVEEVELDCGHWITEERPEETTAAILAWLGR
ncbi:MAG: alpha/beta hydrolase [Actinomycetota bacterium]